MNSEWPRPKPGRTKRNILSNWIAFISTSVIGFLISPFVVHHLGESAYGIWVLIGSLTGYMGLLDLGVRGAVTRYVAKFHTELNHEDSSRVVSSALAVFLALGATAILIAILLANFTIDLFNIPAEFQYVGRAVLIVSGITVAFSLVGGVFGGVIVGLQRFDLSNAVEISTSLLRAGCIVAVLIFGKGILALSIVHLAFSAAALIAYVRISQRIYPEVQVQLNLCDKQHLSLIFSFSFYSFLINASIYLNLYANSIVIGIFLPVSMVTFFAIAGNLANYSRSMISGISTTMTPLASSLLAADERGELERVLLKGARFASLLILPICITFLLRGRSFIGLWMGEKFADLSGNILSILSLALLFRAAAQIVVSTLMGVSRHKLLAPVALVEAVTNLALSIALVRPMGALGVAWAAAISNLFVSVVFLPFYVRRVFDVTWADFVVSSWIRPAIAMLPFALFSIGVDRIWPAPNLFLFFLQVGILLPAAFAGSWFVALFPEDREQLTLMWLSLKNKLLLRT